MNKKVISVLLAVIFLVLSGVMGVLHKNNVDMQDIYSQDNIDVLTDIRNENDNFLDTFNALFELLRAVKLPVSETQISQMKIKTENLKAMSTLIEELISWNSKLFYQYDNQLNIEEYLIYDNIVDELETWLEMIDTYNDAWYFYQNDKVTVMKKELQFAGEKAANDVALSNLSYDLITQDEINTIIEHFENNSKEYAGTPNYSYISISFIIIAILILILGFSKKALIPLIAIVLVIVATITVLSLQKADTSYAHSNADKTSATHSESTTFIFEEESNGDSEYQTTEPTTTPKKLSDECDMILCTGYDDNNYYELVANQIDGYPDSTFEFGVIKNNEWLVEMSNECPFIDEKGWWKWSDDINTISSDNFSYISNGCFLYRSSRYGNNLGIMYKPETSVSFEIQPIDDIFEIDASDRFLAYDIHNEVDYDYQLTLFDMNTGSKKVIGGVFKDYFYAEQTYAISDDIFYAKCGLTWREYEGFYDLNGNIIIDLKETGYKTSYGYVFENGKIILTDYNDSGVKYDLTFDTTGKIIKQEKSAIQ